MTGDKMNEIHLINICSAKIPYVDKTYMPSCITDTLIECKKMYAEHQTCLETLKSELYGNKSYEPMIFGSIDEFMERQKVPFKQKGLAYIIEENKDILLFTTKNLNACDAELTKYTKQLEKINNKIDKYTPKPPVVSQEQKPDTSNLPDEYNGFDTKFESDACDSENDGIMRRHMHISPRDSTLSRLYDGAKTNNAHVCSPTSNISFGKKPAALEELEEQKKLITKIIEKYQSLELVYARKIDRTYDSISIYQETTMITENGIELLNERMNQMASTMDKFQAYLPSEQPRIGIYRRVKSVLEILTNKLFDSNRGTK